MKTVCKLLTTIINGYRLLPPACFPPCSWNMKNIQNSSKNMWNLLAASCGFACMLMKSTKSNYIKKWWKSHAVSCVFACMLMKTIQNEEMPLKIDCCLLRVCLHDDENHLAFETSGKFACCLPRVCLHVDEDKTKLLKNRWKSLAAFHVITCIPYRKKIHRLP